MKDKKKDWTAYLFFAVEEVPDARPLIIHHIDILFAVDDSDAHTAACLAVAEAHGPFTDKDSVKVFVRPFRP